MQKQQFPHPPNLRMLPRKYAPSNGINFNDLKLGYSPQHVFNPQQTPRYPKPQSPTFYEINKYSQSLSSITPPTPSGSSQNGEPSKNFKVVVRARPPLEKEIDAMVPFQSFIRVSPDYKALSILEYLGAEISEAERQRDIHDHPHLVQKHTFPFDRVYDINSTQAEVYAHTAQEAVLSTLQGYNATLLAYGQTGTGKTHTMEGFSYNGSDPERGIVPRAMEEIFRFIQNKSNPKSTFMVRTSYLQIYNDVITDLLKHDRTSLQIRQDQRRGLFVEGLSEWAVRSPGEIFSLMQRGAQSRATAATKMNPDSSRSHAVFIIIVEQMTIIQDMSTGAYEQMRQIKVGKLNLVDLAGSERVRVTGATGKRLEQSKSINQTLSCLGNVIAALTETKQRSHIPYRDSKLTRLLEDSLGGNCKTTMMAMISPTHEAFAESMSTLKFATRAKKIKNQAKINQDVDQRALLRKYEVELRKLKEELAKKNEAIVNNELLLQLEKEKKRAEQDKADAITALEVSSREFAQQKQEKKRLEQKIKRLGSQLLTGGQKIQDLPQFRSALEAHQRIIREEYQGKLADIQRERQLIEEDKAQVDRYKQLLLKQRDIMIALTARVNERDLTIIALQDELDAYDRIYNETEEALAIEQQKSNQLLTIISQNNINLPELHFEEVKSHQTGGGERKYPPSVMSEESLREKEMALHLLTADQKVEELSQLVNDLSLRLQQKEADGNSRKKGIEIQNLEQKIIQQDNIIQEKEMRLLQMQKKQQKFNNLLKNDLIGIIELKLGKLQNIRNSLNQQLNEYSAFHIKQQVSTLLEMVQQEGNRGSLAREITVSVQRQPASKASYFFNQKQYKESPSNLRYNKLNSSQSQPNFNEGGKGESQMEGVIPFNGGGVSKKQQMVQEMLQKRRLQLEKKRQQR